jgi:gliding motility-associated-like protein
MATLTFGQLPAGWTVNAPDYNYSMTLTGFIRDSCVELIDENNGVAAFVGGQCRGVVKTNVDNNGKKYGFLTIYSNMVSNEDVELRFYNATTTDIKVCLDSVVFQSNAVIGSIESPFVYTTNHRPTNLALSNYVVQEATPIGGRIGDFSAQDVDVLQTLNYLLVGNDLDNSSFLIDGNELQLDTVLNFVIKDTYDILVEVNDGFSCAIQDTFTIVVDDNSFPPIAVNDTIFLNEDEVSIGSVLLNDTDYDDDIDSASIVIIIAPVNGTAFSDSLGTIHYTPIANFFGVDSLSYEVSDKTNTGALKDTAWVFYTINPVPDQPVANDDVEVLDEDDQSLTAVLANDTDIDGDIDPGNVQIISGPSHGTAQVINGEVEYVPAADYFGLDTIIYVMCDSTSPAPLCDTAVLSLTINQVPDAPVDISVDTLRIEEDNDKNMFVTLLYSTDVDLPDDSFTYSLVDSVVANDNHHFEIIDDALYIKTKTNFDIKQEYNIRIRTTDEYSLFYEKNFKFTIVDIVGNSIPLPIVTYISNNNDGKNDFLAVADVETYHYFKMTVFDQFGHIVFNVDKSYNNEFDGKVNGEILPAGGYYYWFRSETKEYKGNVTIVN